MFRLIKAFIISLFRKKSDIEVIRNVLTTNAAVSGIDVTLGIDSAGGSTFNELTGQRSTVLSRTIDKADSTNKDSNNWEESVPTIRHWSVSCSGVLDDESDAAYVDLETAYHAAGAAVAQVEVQVTMPSSTTYTGTANIDSLEVDGPHDGIMTYSVELTGDGVLTKA